MMADISTLTSAVAPVAGNSLPVFVADPTTAATMRSFRDRVPYEVFASASLAPGVVIAIVPSAVASATDDTPRFSKADSATLHMEDTSPLPIATGAQGSGVLATPTRSLWQTDALGNRMIMEISWALRNPLGLAWTTATGW